MSRIKWSVVLTILRHPSLQSDIWSEFTKSQNLYEDLVMNKVQAVQHLKKNLLSPTELRIWSYITFIIPRVVAAIK